MNAPFYIHSIDVVSDIQVAGTDPSGSRHHLVIAGNDHLATGFGHNSEGVAVTERKLVALEDPRLAWPAVFAYADHRVGRNATCDDIA